MIDNGNFSCSNIADNCYQCMIINGRHENVIQYREGTPFLLRLKTKRDIAGFLQN